MDPHADTYMMPTICWKKKIGKKGKRKKMKGKSIKAAHDFTHGQLGGANELSTEKQENL